MPILTFKRLADHSVKRIERVNPLTGNRELIDPETGKPASRPCVGFEIGTSINKKFCAEPPTDNTGIGASKAKQLRDDGFLEFVNPRVVSFPGGPPDDPWREPGPVGGRYDFIHCDAIVFLCYCGDDKHPMRYDVVRNPGIYDADSGELLTGTSRYDHANVEVVHFYSLKLASS